jgi:spermidine dehydrogenase
MPAESGVKAFDRELGMDRSITRRDFLDGVALALTGSALSATSLRALGLPPGFAPEKDSSYYPPALTGMRGSHDGSWEVAHQLREGASWDEAAAPAAGEVYDLVVVGGGISGLAAAYFFRRQAGPRARILVLDNHDDFGGHAKRNEFKVGGRLLIGYGGTQSIDGPARYSAVARGLLEDLGIQVQRFYDCFDQNLYRSLELKRGVFFDKATFGVDRLVAGFGQRPEGDFVARIPLSEPARRDLARLYEEKVDYFPGLSSDQKKARLARISYRDYLLGQVRVDADVALFFQKRTHSLFGVGIDAVPAGDCWGLDYPGFAGLGLDRGPGPGMGLTAIPHENEEPYIFHFPDGNASIARLLVRALVPGAIPGGSMEDVVTARADYARLDDEKSPVRIRLNSTVVRVKHQGDPATARAVEVTYVRGGEAQRARAGAVVLACWNQLIPYLCPELPARQKEALAYGVKVPLVYTNVAIRNWQSFRTLGVSSVYCPGSYHSGVSLDFPVSMGDYRFPRSPSEPCLLHLVRTPCSPGLPAREQHKTGRWELLSTSFETFERETRAQLGGMLAGSGFDPATDIEAITVNRWPHGYAYEYNSLFDPDWPEAERPCVIGRQPFGRIHIANSDAAAYAYTNAAIDQAHRTVQEIRGDGAGPVG